MNNNAYSTRAANVDTHPGTPDLPRHRRPSAEVQEERHLVALQKASNQANCEAILERIAIIEAQNRVKEATMSGQPTLAQFIIPQAAVEPTFSSSRAPAKSRGRGTSTP